MSSVSNETGRSDESEVFEVEELLDVRTYRGKVQYRVHWKDWDSTNDTWEPEENLLTCQDMIGAFLAKRGGKSQPPGLELEASDEEEPLESRMMMVTTDSDPPKKGGKKPANCAVEPAGSAGLSEKFREDLRLGRVNVDEEQLCSRVKQRRGRPKKSLNELELMRQATNAGSDQAESSATPTVSPQKRRPGRPRKEKSTAPMEEIGPAEAQKSIDSTSKPKRGRKPGKKSPKSSKSLKRGATAATASADVSANESPSEVDLSTAEAEQSADESILPTREDIVDQLEQQKKPPGAAAQPGKPKNPYDRRQLEALNALGMKLESKDFNINEYRKQVMKLYQNEEGKKLTEEQFLEACRRVDVNAVRRALKFIEKNPSTAPKIDVNVVDPQGNSLLIGLVERPCDPAHDLDDILEMIVQAGADLNWRNNDGKTPLIVAVEKAYLCKVTKLLSLGAAVNLPNTYGETALYVACKLGHSHITYRLLEHGSDFGMSTVGGKGVLDLPVYGPKQQVHCRDMLNAHIKKVKAVFLSELQQVLCGRVKLKTPLFPMHCFALRESDKFRLRFEFNPLDYRHCLTQGGRFGFMLYVGMAQIHPTVSVRFWGPCPTASVTLNGKELKSVTDEGKFLFELGDGLQSGENEMLISCTKNALTSQMKILIQGYFIALKGELPGPPAK